MDRRQLGAFWRLAPGALALSGLLAAAPGPATGCEKMKAATMVEAESVWKGAKAGWIVVGDLYVDAASAAEGMRAAIDPVTGALREPSAAEGRAMSRIAKQQAAGKKQKRLRVRRFSSGMVSVILNEDYMDASLATLNPDGTVRMDCVHGTGSTSQTVQTRAAPQLMEET